MSHDPWDNEPDPDRPSPSPSPSPPAAPELPEGHALRDRLVGAFNCADGYWFSRHDVDAILRALATQGLAIVDAKDRAVLDGVRDACARWANSNRDAEAARFCMDKVAERARREK